MIPGLTASGVLPPFVGSAPTDPAGCSPYRVELSDLYAAFANSPERQRLLLGLLDYREALRLAGVVDGFQLIDGSFTEDCEALRQRPPSDIDVVTFARLPVPPDQKAAFGEANAGLFATRLTKPTYHCDAYFVDLDLPGHLLVEDTAYWFGLFSHQRVTSLWKGLVQVQLASNDADVRAALNAQGGS